MIILSRFRQNNFQIFLLLWGSLLHALVSIGYIASPIALGLFPLHYAISPILQIFNFLGLHFLFSWIYRTLPWRRIASMVLIVEVLILVVPIIVETTLLYLYDSPIDANFILVMLASPRQEIREYLSSLSTDVYGVVVGILAITAIMAGFGTCSFTQYWQRRLKHLASGTETVGLFIVLLVFVACTMRNAMNYHRNLLVNPPRSSNSTDRMFWALLRAKKERSLTAQHLKSMTHSAHFTGFSYHPTVKGPLHIVVILGESARADLMSVYGYIRKTTPHVDSLTKQGTIIPFNDVTSSASSTLFSGQRIFTYWNNTPQKQWFDFPDLINTFTHAGFRTQWLSNQDATDYSSLERIFTFSADTLLTTTSLMDNWAEMSLDERLLPWIYSAPHSAPTFTTIHLVGSHQNYQRRYPQAFEYFKPSDMKECLTDDAKRQKAAYLNSLRYTDHLLEKMIQHYSSQRALVFYFSDHGEMIDEPQQPGYFGHGTNVDHPTIDIPFFVYASPQLRKEHPELWERIKKAQFRSISTAWFTNSLTSLLGIHTKYNDERYNFFSEKFANPTRIAVQGDERHEVPPLKRKRVRINSSFSLQRQV